MAKRKFNTDQLDVEVRFFLQTMYHKEGGHNTALQYIISQFVYTLGELPKNKQVEALLGMKQLIKE
jgi:spore germination protein GerM